MKHEGLIPAAIPISSRIPLPDRELDASCSGRFENSDRESKIALKRTRGREGRGEREKLFGAGSRARDEDERA